MWSALTKAAARGHARGIALVVQQVRDRINAGDSLAWIDAEFPDFGAETDFWAEKYGGASAG